MASQLANELDCVIVGGVNAQKALWIKVCADDWTTTLSTIASNGLKSLLHFTPI